MIFALRFKTKYRNFVKWAQSVLLFFTRSWLDVHRYWIYLTCDFKVVPVKRHSNHEKT